MPLIKTKISKEISKDLKVKIAKNLSSKCADILGKPESYVASIIEDSIVTVFGGEETDFVYIELKSIGSLSPSINKELSQGICQTIQELTDIDSSRVYIEISDIDRAFWGWNGTTFA